MRISDWSSDVCSSDLFAIGAVRIKDVLTPLTLQAQQTRIAMRMRLRKAFESICQFRCSGTTCHSFLSRSSNLALATHAIDVLVRRRMFFPIHPRSEEHTSELQSLMRISYAVFCLKKKKKKLQ